MHGYVCGCIHACLYVSDRVSKKIKYELHFLYLFVYCETQVIYLKQFFTYSLCNSVLSNI